MDPTRILKISLVLSYVTCTEVRALSTCSKIIREHTKRCLFKALRINVLKLPDIPLSISNHVSILMLKGIRNRKENLDFQSFDLHVDKLLQFTQIRTLSIENFPTDDISFLKAFRALEKLRLSNNGIHDLNQLTNLSNLKILQIKEIISDFLPLSSLTSLEELSIETPALSMMLPQNRNEEFQPNPFDALGALKKMRKLSLRVSLSRIPNLSNLSNLHCLNLSFNKSLCDIKGLCSLKFLEIADIGHCSVECIRAFEEAIHLKDLDLRFNKIEDINPLRNCLNLRKLNLNFNKLQDVTPVEALTELTELHLNGNLLSSADCLRNCIKLEVLMLNKNSIAEISCFSSLTNLCSLHVSDNCISNFEPIKQLTRISSLDLSHNKAAPFGEFGWLKTNI